MSLVALVNNTDGPAADGRQALAVGRAAAHRRRHVVVFARTPMGAVLAGHGARLDDADFVEKISELVGNHDVRTDSYSRSSDGGSRSYSYRLDPVLPTDRIRARPRAPPCSSPPVYAPP